MTSITVSTPVPDRVGALYDQYASLCEATLGTNLHFGYWEPGSDASLSDAADHLTDMISDRLGLSEGDKLLDVGCGMGNLAIRVARRTGAQVTGITVSREQVARANTLAAAKGIAGQVRFQYANAMDLPFEDASLDGVMAIESIIHTPDRQQVLREIGRVLRPGGRLVITDFFARTEITDEGATPITRYLTDFMFTLVRPEDYPPMLRKAGLVFTELLDISEQSVRQTFVQMSGQISSEQVELQQEFGDEIVVKFNPEDMIGVREFGHLIVTAQRPE